MCLQLKEKRQTVRFVRENKGEGVKERHKAQGSRQKHKTNTPFAPSAMRHEPLRNINNMF
jgi:hypothetical protein